MPVLPLPPPPPHASRSKATVTRPRSVFIRRSCQVRRGKVSNDSSSMSQFQRFDARTEHESVKEFAFGEYRLRTDDLVLRCRGLAVALAPKVALTLVALIERAGEVVSKEDLFQTVWGDSAVEESNLSQNIYTLRRHFEANGDASLIETLPRRGYRFTGDVRQSTPSGRSEHAGDSRARSIL